jgi:hypothetical protein
MNELGGLNWQQLVSMAAPTRDVCANGPPPHSASDDHNKVKHMSSTGLPRLDFPGLTALCSTSTGERPDGDSTVALSHV